MLDRPPQPRPWPAAGHRIRSVLRPDRDWRISRIPRRSVARPQSWSQLYQRAFHRGRRSMRRAARVGRHGSRTLQHMHELRGADVAPAADQGHVATPEALLDFEGVGERSRAGRFSQRAGVFDHERCGHVDLVVGYEDEVIELPAQDAFPKFERGTRANAFATSSIWRLAQIA